MIPEREALQIISKNRGDSIVVLSYLGKDWPESESHPPEISFVGCMGKAAPFGLGLALARPDKQVIVLEGDGSLLMNLGTLVTIANMAPKNYVCILFENGIYQTTGGHPIPSERNISFVGLAEAAGFPEVYDFTLADELEDHIQEVLAISGPTFINLVVSKDGRRRPITLFKHDFAQFKLAMDKLE
jgi:thiamine pyrophosphate-dependent acetolactate synthase large subunit-like protein